MLSLHFSETIDFLEGTVIKIKTMQKNDNEYILQAAKLLLEGFQEDWPTSWPDLESALEEVNECLSADRRVTPMNST